MPPKLRVDVSLVTAVYAATGSIDKTGDALGVSRSTVKRRLAELGVPRGGPKRIDPDRPSKTCHACKRDKPVTEFNRCRSRTDGRAATCKACWGEVNRNATLQRKYGITAAEYDAILAAQSGCCAICGLPETLTRSDRTMKLAVDHDHATNAVRGLLCADCNNGLGRFRDDPELLRRAADYLEGA